MEKTTRDDLVVRLLGQMMDRLTRLEEKVESLLESSRKVPKESPVPRRKATTKKSTSVQGSPKEGGPRTPSQREETPQKRRTRRKRNDDGKRVVGEGERLRPASAKNGCQKAPRPEQRVCAAPDTEKPAAQAKARASQSFPRVKCVGDTFIPQNKVLKLLREFPVPKARRELVKFIDAARGLREFIPGFEILAAPLTDMLFKRKRKFCWTPEAQRAWDQTKAALAGRLELRQPQPGKAYSVQTEAKEGGIICHLFQVEENGERRTISHTSAKYSPAERKYRAEEKKLLALTWALRQQRDKLGEEPFVLHPEEGSLEWLREHRGDRARLTRWANLLERFRYVVARKAARDKPPVCAPRLKLPEEPRPGEDPSSGSPKKEPAQELNMLAVVRESPQERREPEFQRNNSTRDRKPQRGEGGMQRTTACRSLFDDWDDERLPPTESTQRAEKERHEWNVRRYHMSLMYGEEPDEEALDAARLEFC